MRVQDLKLPGVVHANLRHAAAELPDAARVQMETTLGSHDLVVTSQLKKEQLEAWLFELEKLGELHGCRGGYWRSLQKAARLLDLSEVADRLEKKFHEALRRFTSRQGGHPSGE